MQKLRLLTFGVLFFWALSLSAQIPGYYSSIDLTQNGNALQHDLSALITESHTTLFPYTSSSLDTWDVLKESDLDGDTNNVLLIYGHDDNNEYTNSRTRNFLSTQSSPKSLGTWNREHVFAKSLANPFLETDFPGSGTDVHNIRAVDAVMNVMRSNNFFEDGDGNAKITENGNFYPGDEWKGDVARVLMYMKIRYPTQCDLYNVTYGVSTFSNDMPDIILQWNADDPVSEFELNRNDVIYSYQGNRNPFIDNYALAYLIWGGPKLSNLWDKAKKEFKNNIEDLRLDIDLSPYVSDGDIFVFSDGIISDFEYSLIDYSGHIVNEGKAKPVINFNENLSGVYTLIFKQENRSKSFEIMIE